jgi:hypothetical protein
MSVERLCFLVLKLNTFSNRAFEPIMLKYWIEFRFFTLDSLENRGIVVSHMQILSPVKGRQHKSKFLGKLGPMKVNWFKLDQSRVTN